MPYKDKEEQKRYSKEYSQRPVAKQYHHEYYVKNKEACSEKSKRNRQKQDDILREIDPILLMYRRIKNSATTRKIEFSISKEDITIPEYCPILGIKLAFNRGRPKPNSPSVDRIDNSKGYVKGNIAVISRKANTYKSDLSKEQILNLAKYVS